MKIILYTPQIPQNTGNIIRTCKVTNTPLILVEPLGFQMDEKSLRRAQMDYALDMDIAIVPNFDEAMKLASGPVYFLSSKTKRSFYTQSYSMDTTLVFGNENTGLPPEIMERYQDQLVRIPMIAKERCLNLSNSVAIALYEVLRQNSFCTNLA